LTEVAHVHLAAELHGAEREFADDETGITKLSEFHVHAPSAARQL
jgi:hypothetical protein